jgi:hypothetical protein
MATKPSVENLTTGGGYLYGAAWSGSTPPGDGALASLGNCPELSTNWEEETLEHNSSQGSFLEKDAEPTVKKTMMISFKLDEIEVDNLVMFLQAVKTDAYHIKPLMADTIYYRIKFVPDYGNFEEAWTYDFHKVKIKPAGELNLVSMNAWRELSMEGEVLSDVANHPTSRYADVTLATE